MNLRAAIIGCGAIAEEHVEALASLDGMDPVVYCDIDSVRAHGFLDRYGGNYATDDADRVFADDSLDVVYICTRHDSHAPLAVAAARAGKHILIEKPLALTMEDCLSIGEAVERSGVTLMTAFKLRYYPLVRQVRRFLPTPTMAITQLLDARWPDDFWAQDPVAGGGNVLSQGCHAMDLTCHLVDSEPVRIYAEGGTFTHTGTSVIDTIVATVLFENGVVASVTIGDSGRTPYVSKFSFQIVGGDRSAHLHNRLRTAELFDGDRTETLSVDEESGMVEENREFIAAIRDGRPPATGFRDGLRATSMVLGAFQSIRTGTPQTITIQGVH